MQKTFHEIFKEVEKQKARKDKIAALQKYSGPALKQVLGLTFDPNVKWLLPEGAPPYNPLPKSADQEVALAAELRKMYLFLQGNTDTQRNLKQVRREQLFIGLLESIDPDDAKVVIGMKDGKLPYKGITRKLVAEAFPNLAKNW
jgi:hypothetical protein